ncbi:MAG: YhgE/Pip domain-containing protein [Acidimicrobiales bacterium]
MADNAESDRSAQPAARPMRASRLLRVRAAWITPLILASVVVFLMTLIYFGSVVDPVSHLNGLPVLIVNQDRGATVDGKRVDIGNEVVAGLVGSPPVATRLKLTTVTWAEAREQMSKGSDYATLVIPADFTTSLLALAGAEPAKGATPEQPTITIRTNERLGTIGTSLATGVLQPAVSALSLKIGQSLLPSNPSPALKAQMADPVTLSVVVYRPLPPHSALGLSAFYISLLTLMCGFLGATIVNSSIDSALGYGTTEIGPKWSQRRPVAISRWQTLVAKWVMAAVLAPVLTALMVFGAVGILGMDAPDPFLLWLFTSLAAIGVATGTLVLFAALGTVGQLVALLIFVYLALASSGGTVPIQALSGFFRFVSHFEPLRQIVDGNRALLYFDGQLDAGLGRSLTVIVVELVFWLVVGIVVTMWYDRKQFHRMSPETLAYVNRSVDEYEDMRADDAGSAQ